MGPEYCQGHGIMDYYFNIGVLQVLDMRLAVAGRGLGARPGF